MIRRRTVAAVALLACGLLAGCAEERPAAPEAPFALDSARVDVTTPALRAQRTAAGIAACPPRREGSAQPVPGGLPDVRLPCLGGRRGVELASLRGPLVVNLWAQWCEPCRAELPYFARLHRAGIAVLGVDFLDTQPAAALELAEASGVRYPSVADVHGALRAPLRVPGLPVTVFVDADGRVSGTLATQFDSYAQLAGAVRQHLRVRP